MEVVVEGSDGTEESCESMSLASPTDSVATGRVSIDSSWSIGGLRRNCVQQLRMKYDVSELRNRIAVSESTNDDLRKQLKKKEQEVRHMEEQIRSITDKVEAIQRGEEDIKGDVVNLTKRCKELQRDKQGLQHQLEHSKSQFQNLLKQCQAQERTLADSSMLRVANKVLEQQVEELKQALQIGGANDSFIQRLRQDLERSKGQNQELKRQIVKLQRDNAAVADTCAKSLQNVDQLRMEKEDLTQRFHHDAQQASFQMEQERLAHLAEVRHLKEDLLGKQLNLEESKKASIQDRELLQRLGQDHEDRVKVLEDEHTTHFQTMEAEFNESIDRLQSKLEEKNNVISKLQEEVSRYMQEVMTLTASLDESQGQKMLVEDRNAAIMDLQQECMTLKEEIAAKELSLSDMSTRVALLAEANESMAKQQKMAFESHQHDMDSQKNLAASVQQGLRQSLSALQNESDSTREQFQHSLDELLETIATLEEQVAMHDETKAELQEARDIIAKNDCTIDSLQTDLARATDKLEHDVKHKNELELQYAALRAVVGVKEQLFEADVNEYSEILKKAHERVQALEQELKQQVAARDLLVIDRDTLEKSIASRNQTIAEMTTHSANLEIQVTSELELKCAALRIEFTDERQRLESSISAHLDSLNQQERLIQNLDKELQRQAATNSALLQERDTVNKTLLSMQATISEMSTRLTTSQLERESVAQQLLMRNTEMTEISARVVSYQTDMESLTRQLAEKNAAIAEMTTRSANLETEKENLIQQLATKDVTIAEVTAHATSLILDKESITKQHILGIDRNQRAMDSRNQVAAAVESGLRESLRAVKNDSGANCRQLQQVLASLEVQVATQQSLIHSLQADCNVAAKTLALENNLKTDLEKECSALRSELKIVQHCYDNEATKYRQRIHALEAEVASKERTLRSELDAEFHKLRSKIAIQDDEIRELTLVDLHESEDMIRSLKVRVGELEEELQQSHSTAAVKLSKLESEFDENRALLADRDRKLLSTAADSQQSIERLKSIVAELQEEKSTLKADFSKQQAKLHEIEAAQARLVRKNSLFTQKDHLLREECRQLQALEQDWKAEREKLKNEEEKLRLHVQTLEAKVSDKEQKAELAWRRTSDVEKKLEERASVLSQMVQLNQNLECELAKEKSSSHLTGVTMEQLRQDLEAKNEEASRLKNDLLRKEEQFEETLHQERMQREIAESNLKSLKSQLNNVRLDSKAISDLQKENVELLAKVKRQEAMIKRKIDKDKALRNRTTFLTNSKDAPSCPTNAKDPMATPGRGGSTVKPPRGIISSVTTKDHMATPGRGGSSMIPPRGFSTSVKIARSCQSIASDVSSVSQDDWELDSVLYD